MLATLTPALKDRYAIDREIGRGGMATVFLARDIRHNRKVAARWSKSSVTSGASFSIGNRHVVLTGSYLTDTSHPNWDVAPDGRILMLKRAGEDAQAIVVHNWGTELREKTMSRK